MKLEEKKDFYFLQMLIVPIFILIFSLFFLKINRSTENFQAIFKYSHLMADYLFFNTLHIPLPFLLVFFVPEFRKWSKIKGISGPFSFWGNSTVIFGISFIFLYLGSGIIREFAVNDEFFFIAMCLRLFLIGFHAAGQSMGISLLLNRYTNLEKSIGFVRLNKIRIFEKILIWSLVILMLAASVVGFKHVQILTPHSIQDSIRIFLFIMVIIIVSLLVLYPLFFPKNIRWIKFIFHLRYLFYILDFFTPLSLIGHWCAHGTEYLFITKKVIANNASNLPKRFWKFSLLVIVAWGVFVFARTIELFNFQKSWLHLYLSIAWAGDLTHYWADRVIYRMKNQETRELIAPSLS